MRERPPELYGIPINELARICHVSVKTAARWKSGATCPPKSARLLLAADLACLDPTWAGWCVRNGKLVSPEGWEITMRDVIGLPLRRQEMAAYKSELKRLKEKLLLTQEQPLPEVWPAWVFEKLA